MKLFYKMFLGIFISTLVIFSIFGTFLVNRSYQSALLNERERVFQENQMYQYAFLTAYENLPENRRNEENAADVAESIWNSMGDKSSVFVLSDANGKLLYQSHNYTEYGIDRSLKAGQSVNRIVKRKGEYYLDISSCLEIDDTAYYMGRMHNISRLYADRDRLIEQYRIAIVFVFFVMGIWAFLFSRSLTQPLRQLSSVTKQFALGDYKIRATQRGSDEVSALMHDFNRMADALEESMRELKLAAKKQEDFTAAFAHELKTPLTSIIGYSDMLRSMDLASEERTEASNYIYQQGKRLERLAYKLMEMMDVEHYNYSFGAVELKVLSEDLSKLIRPLMDAGNIECEIDFEKGSIYGDRDLLLSLFVNLADNARKACVQNGKITIKGIMMEEYCRIIVADNGCGIPEEEIGRITEAFYMVDKSRSRKEGGAGIGLALCMKIIQLHEGTWEIASELGQGTDIIIELPVKQSRKGCTVNANTEV